MYDSPSGHLRESVPLLLQRLNMFSERGRRSLTLTHTSLYCVPGVFNGGRGLGSLLVMAFDRCCSVGGEQ